MLIINSVQNLKSKISDPYSSPPSPPSKAKRRGKPRRDSSSLSDDDVESESESAESDEERQLETTFDPSRCLFCISTSDGVDTTLKHMSTAHSFSIPFQDCLAVDLETVVAFLQFIVYGYHECISCHTQRSTVEAIQQHMTAKGHCRFDVSEDTEEFYQLSHEDNAIQQTQHDSVRLPSGKIITQQTREPRIRRQAQTLPVEDSSSPAEGSAPGMEVARRGERNRDVIRSSEALVAAQLSRLRVADDRVQQRAAVRKRHRLEQANNTILRHRFRVSAGDSRFANHM